MLRLVVALLLLCCALAAGHHFHINRCMPSFGKYPFDEQKFSGDWYAVASVFRPKKFPPGEKTCDKIHYSAEKVGNVTRIHLDILVKMADGKEMALEAKGQAIKQDWASSTNMAVKFSKDHKDAKWHGVSKHSILATDYTSYALVHGCKDMYDEKADMFGKMVLDQIWSRTKTLDPEVLKTLKSVMSSLDIADEDWELVDMSGC